MKKNSKNELKDKRIFEDEDTLAVRRRLNNMNDAEFEELTAQGQRDLEAAVRRRARRTASENRKAQTALAALRKRAA